MTDNLPRMPIPPFNQATAEQKVRLAEDAWNGGDPAKIALAYSPNSKWRNRVEFFEGRNEIESFLTRKWEKEGEYRLIKDLWAYSDNRIAVRYAYEYRDENGHWFRAYGNENWEFDENGYMASRHASINEKPISDTERKFHWPLGRRPDNHPSLTDLDL